MDRVMGLSAHAKASRVITSAPMQLVWAAVTALGLYWLSPGWLWLDVHAVRIQPAWRYSKDSPAPVVDAVMTVRGPIVVAQWTAEVQRMTAGGWVQECGRVPFGFVVFDADLAKDSSIDFDDWTGGMCPAYRLPPGSYRVRTTWSWDGPLGYRGTTSATSNVFLVEVGE